MLPVHGAVDGGIGKLWLLGQLLGRAEGALGGDVKDGLGTGAPHVVGFGNADDPKFIGPQMGIGSVADAAVSGANDDRGHRFLLHDNWALPAEFNTGPVAAPSGNGQTVAPSVKGVKAGMYGVAGAGMSGAGGGPPPTWSQRG